MRRHRAPVRVISIHALREESDVKIRMPMMDHEFQSTLSVRRATAAVMSDFVASPISIHALREESDRRGSGSPSASGRFQSTLSVRRATHGLRRGDPQASFQSTLSVRRATAQLDIFVRFLRRKPAA